MANWAQKLKLHHLQMLVLLGELGNLTRVAQMMNITQPALSKWLLQFEDEIGITLFERHSKGLRPSSGGKLLLQHAQRLIHDMERSQYEITRFKQTGLVGSLKVGCSPVATHCVSQAILSLLNEMPALNLYVEEKVMTLLLHDLLTGALDVVVGRVGSQALQLPLNYQMLYTEPVCFVACRHHPLAKCATLGWDDLGNFPWIVWPIGTPIRLSLDNTLVNNGVILPENTIESSSLNVTINLLQSSNMISILSLRLAKHYASQGHLAILNLPKIEQRASVGVFWRNSDSPSGILNRFLYFLKLC